MKRLWLTLFILVSLFATNALADSKVCKVTLDVKTGSWSPYFTDVYAYTTDSNEVFLLANGTHLPFGSKEYILPACPSEKSKVYLAIIYGKVGKSGAHAQAYACSKAKSLIPQGNQNTLNATFSLLTNQFENPGSKGPCANS